MCIHVWMSIGLPGCRLVIRKYLTHLVVLLSLLVTVHVAAWYYISLPSLRGRTRSVTAIVNSTRLVSRLMPTCVAVANHNNTRVIEVKVDDNFTERVVCFNVELQRVRRQLRVDDDQLPVDGGNTSSTFWTSSAEHNLTVNSKHAAGQLRVVDGVKDDYIDELADDSDIVTVALPWLRSRSNWNSLTDFYNVPYQRYFDWTADNVLCSWIEQPGVIKMHYDAIYNRICNRNINDSAQGRSLRPVHLQGKPINRRLYWPNNGKSFPAHYYTDAPSYVFHMHVHRDAVVTPLGDVITARTKLVLYACSHDVAPTSPRDVNIPRYDEVYVISQFWGTAVFHRMIEIVPRLLVALQFLKAYPEIRILGPQVGGRLAELLEIIGVDRRRLVTGAVRAKIVYQPRATGCGFANVQESQMLSQLYHDYIRRTFPPRPRDRLILIRRSRSRRFTEQKAIEEVLTRAARDYNLTYTVFIDNPTPSLNDTMVMFHSAVLIVAPVGAGESNIFFSQPGTYVVEGVCNLPHVNLCFMRLAHILGHHWHGVTSRGGCETVVDVKASNIENAVRSYLHLWTLEHSSPSQ